MRFVLAIIACAQVTLGMVLLPRPLVRFAGYFGGRDKDAANAIAVDQHGYIYVVGSTDSPDFPSTPDGVRAESGVNNDDWVGFAAKFAPGARRVVYSTFIGGSYRTFAKAVAVDQAGDAFVVGTTCSSDFLVTPNAFESRAPGGGKGVEGCDAFVAKLDASGSHYLYATYLGGSGSDTATSVWVDTVGDAWVAGYTTSPDFPVTGDAVMRHMQGTRKGFLAELDPQGKHLLYGTYLGGAGDDCVQAMASGGNSILYLVGASDSADFLKDPTRKYSEGFVLPFSVERRALAGPVLPIGGAGYTAAAAVAVGSHGDIYVAGTTNSLDFPASTDAFQHRMKGTSDAFWARLQREIETGRLRITYASLLGGSQYTSGDAITVDRNGAVTLGGRTTSADLPVTPTALVPNLRRTEDAYLMRFAPGGSRLEFGSFVGGGTMPTTFNAGVNGLATDESGNLYVAAMVNEPSLMGTDCALSTRPAGNLEPLILELTFGVSQTADVR